MVGGGVGSAGGDVSAQGRPGSSSPPTGIGGGTRNNRRDADPVAALEATLRAETAAAETPQQKAQLYGSAVRRIRDLLEARSGSGILTMSDLGRLSKLVPPYPTYGELQPEQPAGQQAGQLAQQRGRPRQRRGQPAVVSLQEWLEALVEHRVVVWSGALLTALLDALVRLEPPPPPPQQQQQQHRQQRQQQRQQRQQWQRQQRQPAGAAACCSGGGGAVRDADMQRLGWYEILIELTAIVQRLQVTWDDVLHPPAEPATSSSRCRSSAMARLHARLLQQATDEGLMRAISRVQDFIQRTLWTPAAGPLPRQPPSGSPAGVDAAASSGSRTAGRLAGTADASAAAEREEDFRLGCQAGSGILREAIMLVRAMLRSYTLLGGESTTTSSTGSGAGGLTAQQVAAQRASAQRASSQRFLELLKRSDVVDKLCGSILGAPPPSAPPQRDQYAHNLAGSFVAMQEMLRGMAIAADSLGAVAVGPLESPSVRRFQRECLQQVAATAAPETPTLLRPQPELWLVTGWNPCAEAALSPITHLDGVGEHATAVRVLQGLFPSRAEMASVGVGVVRALHRRLTAVRSTQRGAVAAAAAAASREQSGSTAAGSETAAWRSVTAAAALEAATATANEYGIGIGGDEAQLPLLLSARAMTQLTAFRMRGTEGEEVRAATPDLLEMVAWLIGMEVQLVGLTRSDADVGTNPGAVARLSEILQGKAPSASAPHFMRGIFYDSGGTADLWQQLGPAVRAATLERLAPTDLPRSLDGMLRDILAHPPPRVPAPPLGSGAPPSFTPALAELLSALLRNQMRRRYEAERQSSHEGAAGSDDGAAAAGVAPDDRRPGLSKDRCVAAQSELGVVISLLKVLRRGELQMLHQEQLQQQELQQEQEQQAETLDRRRILARFMALLCFTRGAGLAGLMDDVTTELNLMQQQQRGSGSPEPPQQQDGRRAARSSGGGGGGSRVQHKGSSSNVKSGSCSGGGRETAATAGSSTLALVVQTLSACGFCLLRYFERMVVAANTALAAAAQLGSGSGGGRTSADQAGSAAAASDDGSAAKLFAVALRIAEAAGRVLRVAAESLPPAVLTEVAPQRLLAALGALLLRLQRSRSSCAFVTRDTIAASKILIHTTKMYIARTVMALSADERLLAGCVPGWLWAEPCELTDEEEDEPTWAVDLDALAALLDTASVTPGSPDAEQRQQQSQRRSDVRLPYNPIVTVELGVNDPAALRFASWDWATEHGRRQGEVAAMARRYLRDNGSRHVGIRWGIPLEASPGMDAAVAGGQPTDDGCGVQGMWPPRLLRLCANPSCGDFSGGSETELKLRLCSRCKAVRYCSTACQKDHWRAHRWECAAWAAEQEQQQQHVS